MGRSAGTEKENTAFQNEIKRYEGSGISEKITYYHCEKNVGLCAALNFGIDAAKKLDVIGL